LMMRRRPGLSACQSPNAARPSRTPPAVCAAGCTAARQTSPAMLNPSERSIQPRMGSLGRCRHPVEEQGHDKDSSELAAIAPAQGEGLSGKSMWTRDSQHVRNWHLADIPTRSTEQSGHEQANFAVTHKAAVVLLIKDR